MNERESLLQSISKLIEESLAQALVHQKQGQFQQAERLYRSVIQAQPRQPDANCNLGILLSQSGNVSESLSHFKVAVESCPNQGAYWINYINALILAGQPDKARAMLEQSKRQGLSGAGFSALGQRLAMEQSSTMQSIAGNTPDHQAINQMWLLFSDGRYAEAATIAQGITRNFPLSGFAWKVGGLALKILGRDAEALLSMQQAARLLPDDDEVQQKLGLILSECGRNAEAETAYLHAIELNPRNAELHNELGTILAKLNRHAESEKLFCRAIELNPGHAYAYNNLGLTYMETKRLSQAEESFRHAIQLNPEFAAPNYNLGRLLHEAKRFSEAETAYRGALVLHPNSAQTLNNLGRLLHETKRFSEAETAYRGALVLHPNSAQTLNNLGLLFQETKRLLESEAAYRRSIELNPNSAETRWNLSSLLLSQGRFEEGWPLHESRLAFSRTPKLPFPQWQGESLQGKSFVIWPEQGFGDYVQFARYATLLKGRGVSRLTLFCAEQLSDLLATINGVDDVVTNPALLSDHDYGSCIISLPLYFGTTMSAIPNNMPYLHPLQDRLERWQNRLPLNKIKVGLVYKGNESHKNDLNRSLPDLSVLSPLWSVPGVVFLSLQKGINQELINLSEIGQPVISLGSEIRDFADTAAIVAQLDLIISVDTAVAHIAGALGKACWVLLPSFGTDWRWLRKRSDSPWYPEVMRLFRQTSLDDWSETIREVTAALKSWGAMANTESLVH